MTLKIYIGWDSREDLAFQVCRHSILRHAAEAPAIYPLRQASLRELGLYTRPPDQLASTEFSLTRFLVPWLSGHEGWALFVDCDFLFTADIGRVFDHVEPGKAVHVVKHDYTPAHAVKMDGQVQTAYPRKNWSSFMLFDGTHPAVRALTPGVVNAATPAFLHRFQWLEDAAIGALPLGWNFLEGEYPCPAEPPPAIHFTNGGPWFAEWADVDYAALWLAERDRWLATA
jgi:lipopolysaccharide biosynthesis glycosyltransferase